MSSLLKKSQVHLLCIGDPHFKENNVEDTLLLHQRIDEHLKNYKASKGKDYDAIVVLGDTLDRHQNIHVDPLERVDDFMAMLQTHTSKLYILVGNHDRPNNSVFLTKQHPFNSYKKWKGVKVVDIPMQERIHGHLFTFVPYVYDGRFQEMLDLFSGKVPVEDPKIKQALLSHHTDTFDDLRVDDIEKSSCIFAHQSFFMAKMGSKFAEKGDKWALSNPHIISGHIHGYDQLQPNILYVGTPMPHTFGESSSKTISDFLFYADDQKSKTGKPYKETRFDLKMPKKIKKEILYKNIASTKIRIKEDHLKIIIIGTASELLTASKMRKVKGWEKKGIKVDYRYEKDQKALEMNVMDHRLRKTYEETLIENLQARDPDGSLADLYKSLK